ncbi:MAG: carboxylesterase/lipase family protein, partial [Eubacterium sp.]|nr:carboxylesterase/lipase family protein [Eubacterium sp.]
KNVMVFFHGGAYGWGGTTDPMYNGYNFAKDNTNTIIVTCNYRLGLMGFADFSQIPGGEEYTDLNLAIRDHVCALQWIKKNIANFGGNPDNITIFGESAGGWSVSALLVSPLAKGLFNRAIIESGGLPVGDIEDAQEFAEYICEASGCETMEELKNITAEEWIQLDTENWIADECCGLVCDGVVIPEEEDWDAALQEKINDGVSILLGANADEWNYFKEDAEGETDKEKFDSWYEGMNELWDEVYEDCDDAGKATMDKLYKILESKVPEEYAKDAETKDALTKSKFCTESWRLDHNRFADRYADLGGTVYMYYWDVPSTLEKYYKSAVHAVELAYVFNNLDDGIYAGEVDRNVAGETQGAWIVFAATGDPSIGEHGWAPYTTENRETMMIRKGDWETVNDPMGEVREMMESIGAYDLMW